MIKLIPISKKKAVVEQLKDTTPSSIFLVSKEKIYKPIKGAFNA